MAQSINTHASLVRRLLGVLAGAGLTVSQMGTHGGAMLARDARTISLLDVHRAVDAQDVFAMPREAPSPHCVVGRNIQASLESCLDAARGALEAELARTSIADILVRVQRREADRVGTGPP